MRASVASLSLLLGAWLAGGCSPVAPPSNTTPVEPPSRATSVVTAAPAAAPTTGAWVDAEHVDIDGFRLGSLYASTVMSRAPYDAPCDDDPIDGRTRRFMVYGARPCRERVFPEGTTVAFYLRYDEGPRELDQQIEAVAWLGGGYFSSRSSFPVRIGEPAPRAVEVLGAAEKTFAIERKGQAVTVQRHRGHAWVLVDGGKIVGVVLGPMPDDPQNEQWRGLMQMYVRYTEPPR